MSKVGAQGVIQQIGVVGIVSTEDCIIDKPQIPRRSSPVVHFRSLSEEDSIQGHDVEIDHRQSKQSRKQQNSVPVVGKMQHSPGSAGDFLLLAESSGFFNH